MHPCRHCFARSFVRWSLGAGRGTEAMRRSMCVLGARGANIESEQESESERVAIS